MLIVSALLQSQLGDYVYLSQSPPIGHHLFQLHNSFNANNEKILKLEEHTVHRDFPPHLMRNVCYSKVPGQEFP